ncbi:MAG: NUDIX hydrolase [Patescibacteria group bacterium]
MQYARLLVAAVIIDESGRVLLCKRSMNKKIAPGAWHMPGGGIDEGESMEGAAVRELREELGFIVSSVVVTDVTYVFDADDGQHHLTFVRVIVSGDVVLNDENESFEWVLPENFQNYLEPHVLDVNLRAANFKI